ncbi:acyl-CoA dehydrogenase, partial [Fischerella thermalis CCMEE 5319]
VHWVMQYAFAQIQSAFEGIFQNFSVPVLDILFAGPVSWWWRLNPIGSLPSDKLGSEVARKLQTPGQIRDRLTAGIYIPTSSEEALGRLEKAFILLSQAEPLLKKLKNASHTEKLPQQKPDELISAALQAGVISNKEVELICEAEFARNDAIQVDSFTLEEYLQGTQESKGRWQMAEGRR